jgi:hypothetical protein
LVFYLLDSLANFIDFSADLLGALHDPGRWSTDDVAIKVNESFIFCGCQLRE